MATIRDFMKRVFPTVNQVNTRQSNAAMVGKPLYAQLEAYYLQNGLYDPLMSANYALSEWHEEMKPLRNPANRSVEFFVSNTLPGSVPSALPIVTDNNRIVEPIQQVWKWEGFNQNKPKAIRWLSNLGDLFIQCVTSPNMDKVYRNFIKPTNVTLFQEDARGNIIKIRLDVRTSPMTWHTEIWTMEGMKVWENTLGEYQAEQSLPSTEIIPLSTWGIDFIPFVHIKFRDIGDLYGMGCFSHCLDKIDEVNRMATRMHVLMFRHNKPYWAVSANANDSEGKPLPPPSFKTSPEDLDDNALMRLPGTSKLDALIPDLDYNSYSLVVDKQLEEIEKDLPELAYYRLREQGELSGKAVRLLLGDALSRIKEARTNFEAGLIKSEIMVLTIGQRLGIWSGLGEYDNGDLDHEYKERELLAVSIDEKAETMKKLVDAGISTVQAARMSDIGELEITN
jgi:hypothetical protein